mgnify:FL=1
MRVLFTAITARILPSPIAHLFCSFALRSHRNLQLLSPLASKNQAMCCRVPSQGISVLAICGILVASYALYVEYQIANEPFGSEYVASCDVMGMSCTAVFRSKYAHILSHWGLVPEGSALDLGLATAGLSLYTGFLLYPILTCIPGRKTIVLAVSLGSICFSLYLLYVLKFVLGEFCIVCTSFHAINFSMFYLVVREYRATPNAKSLKDKR